ncbi:hypothetical protein MUU72_19745 [Streptomyces sp. RS10V-4]|uniref:hypothetical protein n=1 Tax=Streptomyces rhizoryzae TaxID=2932493 RepID=UPI00200335DA|nr:hypothetical protein [Streptomyces rhizoryzae]MCK7625312.1 hypothetical protein [Streptomyces rhizoryzae]
MSVGLLSAVGICLYGVTLAVLAFTATFARRAVRRREARATLGVLVLLHVRDRHLAPVPPGAERNVPDGRTTAP